MSWKVLGKKIGGVEFGPWTILDTSNGRVVAMSGDGCSDRKEAELLAAAPEMARLLAELIKGESDVTTSHIDGDDRRMIEALLRKAGVA